MTGGWISALSRTLRGLRPEREDTTDFVTWSNEDPPAVAWTKAALSAMLMHGWQTLRIHDRNGLAVSEPAFPDPPTATFVTVRNRLAVMTDTLAPWQTTGQRQGCIQVSFHGQVHAFRVDLVDAATIDLHLIDPLPAPESERSAP